MKKFLTISFIAIFSMTSYAQDDSKDGAKALEEVTASLSYGFITGDSTFTGIRSGSVSVDFNFLFNVTDDLKLGAVAGASHYLYKSGRSASDYDDVLYTIPMGATFRLYTENDRFYIGSDAGYAIGVDTDGGFFYRPKVGMSLTDHSGITMSYSEIIDTATLSTFSIGYEFSF